MKDEQRSNRDQNRGDLHAESAVYRGENEVAIVNEIQYSGRWKSEDRTARQHRPSRDRVCNPEYPIPAIAAHFILPRRPLSDLPFVRFQVFRTPSSPHARAIARRGQNKSILQSFAALLLQRRFLLDGL